MYVILCGNPVDGIQVHGPFPSSDEACEWAECGLKGESWWVTDLHNECVPTEVFYTITVYSNEPEPAIIDWIGPYDDQGNAEAVANSIENHKTAIFKCERIK